MVAASGGVVLLGWAFDIEVLKSVLPMWVTMKANTAACFVLAGFSLWCKQQGQTYPKSYPFSQACAAMVVLVGSLTWMEYLFGWNLGIDQLLFREGGEAIGTSSPGRMAPNTALAFLTAGAALLMLDVETKRGTRPAQFLTLADGSIGWLALVGYAYGVRPLYGVASFTQMAFHTAIAFTLLSAGILASRPSHGLVAVFTSSGAGGVMARRMLPVGILVPAALGYLRLWGERMGFYGTELGVAFVAISSTIVFSAWMMATAQALNAVAEERQRVQEEKAQQARTLEAILSSIGEGVVVADTNGKFLVWNPAAEKIVGLGAKDVSPGEWSRAYGFFLPDQKTPYPSEDLPLARAIGGGSVDNDEQFLRHAGAPEGRYLNVTGRPLRDSSGILQGGVVVFRDVTQQKQAQKELEAFSYSVSHDLRSPLRHIDGFIELLQKRLAPNADSQVQRYLATISGSAKRMGDLIDELLAFSRMGRAEMRETRVDLISLLDQVRRELGPDEKGQKVEWKIGELPEVEGDPAMLCLVLSNLVRNALKFTRTRNPAVIEVGTRGGRPGRTVIFVRDNGVGFDMQYAGKLFGVFQRLHRQEEFEGTGIGLANVRRIVHRHGGETWAESSMGAGATFYFSLPTAKQGGA
ncbi:MAG: PAS domain S-box protein [Elusimicrobia bacterium]|nr:PAS domain S-box protein [Elusimicrobiota bacterium]